eukprot:2358657-Rhodomonas_salina.2
MPAGTFSFIGTGISKHFQFYRCDSQARASLKSTAQTGGCGPGCQMAPPVAANVSSISIEGLCRHRHSIRGNNPGHRNALKEAVEGWGVARHMRGGGGGRQSSAKRSGKEAGGRLNDATIIRWGCGVEKESRVRATSAMRAIARSKSRHLASDTLPCSADPKAASNPAHRYTFGRHLGLGFGDKVQIRAAASVLHGNNL